MPNFIYKAKSGPQKTMTGVVSADNEQQAVNKILQMGQVPLEVKLEVIKQNSLKEIRLKRTKKELFKVPLAQVAVFTRQVADMNDAGVPLMRCLEVLIQQRQENVDLQAVIEDLHKTIKGGWSFSDALEKHLKVFPSWYVNMVRSGELSGNLPQVLNRLADFIEKDLQMQSQVKSSLLYPAIIFVVGVLTMFVLLTFVLPKLTIMFDDFDAALPLPTQIVIAISEFFARFWWLMVAVMAAGVYYFQRWVKTDQGRMKLEAGMIKIPLLKDFIKAAETARFSRTMATLLESGVTVPAALQSVTAVVDNYLLKSEMEEITQKVNEGGSLTSALKQSRFFSAVAVNLIAVGEESGKLEQSLYKLAKMYERETTEKSQNFVTILGPLVLVIVVGLVGFVIIAMLLPMFRMNMIIN